MSSREDRNYYTHLFSPDSDSTFSQGIFSDHTRDYYRELFSPDTTIHPPTPANCDDAGFGTDAPDSRDHSGLSQPQKVCHIENLNQLLTELNDHIDPSHNHYDQDQDSDEIPTLSESVDSNEIHSDRFSNDISTASSDSRSLEFLNEDEMIRLLEDDSEEKIKARAQHYADNSDQTLSLNAPILHTESNIDRIGTFNIQNQYDHALAAKLFLEGEFTFLSFQEPFATQTSINDAWGACRRFELNSARIACYETHHQVIMFDNWRWGGKIIDNFTNLLNGRITSIAFGFENQQSIGIISIYGIAMGSIDADQLQRKNDLRRTIVFAVRKISRQWKKKFPQITIMIMGDMQETLTTSDFDNLGKCRYAIEEDLSILQSFQDSHTSIVRDHTSSDSRYLTRFGTEGARGIDHILFPKNDSAQSMVHLASIDTLIGSRYFPSDHKLLSCSVHRRGGNNAEIGDVATRFAFRSIFQIKMKRTGSAGDSLEFDTSQFKECTKYKHQESLFKKVQMLTCDSSPATDFHLRNIEKSISSLYASLWKDGEKQGADGRQNKLVKISERQAAELSAISNKFDLGIKDNMTFLHLTNESDCMGNMARTRHTLKKKGNFKLFGNLPVSTKLRYLRSWIKEKKRRLKRYSIFIAELEMRQKHNVEFSDFQNKILQDWNSTLNVESLSSKAKDTYDLILKEMEERSNHIDAIKAKKSPNSSNNCMLTRDSTLFQKGNDLQHISEATIKLINFWLTDSGCKQCFNSAEKRNTFEFLANNMEDWTSELKNINNESFRWECTDTVQKLKESIANASKMLGNIEAKVGRAQRTYKSNTLEYLLKVNKIEDFTRKVRPKSREAPATHTEIWDSSFKKFRPCRNEKEELTATANHHGTWMGNSKAEENCAFAHLDHQGLLGIRGVNLTPDRKITMKDIPRLVHNGEKLKHKDKLAFIAAHGEHTSKLFRLPEKDHSELSYPFFWSLKLERCIEKRK